VKNLTDIMKQAQQLQSRMADLQTELDGAEVEGRAGGGIGEAGVHAIDGGAFGEEGTGRGAADEMGDVRDQNAARHAFPREIKLSVPVWP
jgi:hypothetical protein